MGVLLLPFQLGCLLFLSCLIAVAKTSNTVFKRCDENGNPCLVPDLLENTFSLSPLSMMLAVGLSYMTFIMLRYIPSIFTLLRVFFIINGCWALLNAFSASIDMIIWFLFFNLLMWCITLIDLQILN
uniref:Uncharacterized protein n=1 Tax=Rousettus aegyptiacus TaxID=9407 RepID=A0A7J8EJW8_ROUAE|nr:hypothetical protein HJG63_012522 [Rousettus aegyptiacus]